MDVIVIAVMIYIGLLDWSLRPILWPMLVQHSLPFALLYGASNLFNLPLTHLVLRSSLRILHHISSPSSSKKNCGDCSRSVGFFSFQSGSYRRLDSTILTISQGRWVRLSHDKARRAHRLSRKGTNRTFSLGRHRAPRRYLRRNCSREHL